MTSQSTASPSTSESLASPSIWSAAVLAACRLFTFQAPCCVVDEHARKQPLQAKSTHGASSPRGIHVEYTLPQQLTIGQFLPPETAPFHPSASYHCLTHPASTASSSSFLHLTRSHLKPPPHPLPSHTTASPAQSPPPHPSHLTPPPHPPRLRRLAYTRASRFRGSRIYCGFVHQEYRHRPSRSTKNQRSPSPRILPWQPRDYWL